MKKCLCSSQISSIQIQRWKTSQANRLSFKDHSINKFSSNNEIKNASDQSAWNDDHCYNLNLKKVHFTSL
jgi:hypothetical protein